MQIFLVCWPSLPSHSCLACGPCAIQKFVQFYAFLETFKTKKVVNFNNGSYSLGKFRIVARDGTCLSASSVTP